MAGLAGFVTKNPDRDAAERLLAKMLRVQVHQPSWSWSSFSVPEHGIYVGWVNTPSKGANPLTVHNGERTLVFCGENFVPTTIGHSRPDGRRAVLSALEDDPKAFVRALNGWFAGVLIDQRKREVVLFNDRYGMHRVYYCRTPDSFFFASEAKSLLAVRPETRSLDPEAVGHFLGFGTVFANRTLFANVSLLPGASCWSIATPDAVKTCRYFEPGEWEAQSPLSAEVFQSSLSNTLRRVLPSYFAADTPVGLSLTGGLDTRMVMAGIPLDGEPRPCYTYGGVYRECFDITVARKVAAACNLSYSVLPLGAEFFENFLHYAERTVWLTDGCLDLTGSHEIYYSELARQYSPVRLTGNYGSEILRNVSTFKYRPVSAGVICREVLPVLEAARDHYSVIAARHPVTFAAFSLVPWHLAGRRIAAESVLVLRSPYLDNDLVALVYRAPQAARETSQACLRVIRDIHPSLARIPTDLGHGGNGWPVARTLTKIHRYLSFKGEWYYNLGMPDWLVRNERSLPLRLTEPLFLGSHKIEHYRLWFSGPLRRSVIDLFADPDAKTRPYLDPVGVRGLLDDLEANRRNCVEDISRLGTLELVQRRLIQRSYDCSPSQG